MELKEAKRTVTLLSKSLGHAIQEACNIYTTTFLSDGLESMPDDILRLIFEMGFQERIDEALKLIDAARTGPSSIPGFIRTLSPEGSQPPCPSKLIQHVSFVSQRFRRVALSTPRLWSVLSNLLSSKEIERRLQLSGDTGLQIFFYNEGAYSHMLADFLALITPSSHRWEAFHAFASYETRSSSDTTVFREQLIALHLPRLVYLRICDRQAGVNVGSDVKELAYHYYSSWVCPMLKQLEASHSLPIRPKWENVNICAITIAARPNSPFDIAGFLGFLRALPALRKLVINLMYAELSKETIGVLPVELPVKVFHLHASGSCPDSVMSLICLPHVTDISVSFSGLGPNPSLCMLHAYPSTRKLAIILCSDSGYMLSLGSIISGLVRLEMLYIRGPMFDFDLDASRLPPLRAIHLDLCDNLLSDNLPYLNDTLKHLNTIIVQRCRKLSRDFVAAQFPDKKLEWYA